MDFYLQRISKLAAERTKKDLSLFDFLMIGIITISVFSLLFLVAGLFRVDLVLISSLLTTVLIIHFFYVPTVTNITKSKHFIPMAILLFAALFFRSEPYQYIIGGQDEGIYVNMSKAFKQSGEVFQYDKIRQEIFDPDLRRHYDEANIRYEHHETGKFEGHYLGGVYVADADHSKYVFQFYHLHPL